MKKWFKLACKLVVLLPIYTVLYANETAPEGDKHKLKIEDFAVAPIKFLKVDKNGQIWTCHGFDYRMVTPGTPNVRCAKVSSDLFDCKYNHNTEAFSCNEDI